MKEVLIIFILGIYIGISDTYCQDTLSISQQNFIQTRALSKVKTYTEYLELYSRKDGKSVDDRNEIRHTIYFAFGPQGSQTRIYNDLIPLEILNKYNIQSSLPLELYLNEIYDFYGSDLQLSYSRHKASKVYYSREDNFYFVKITATRNLKGIFDYSGVKVPQNLVDEIDFFVSANFVDGKIRPDGIYGINLHTEKIYQEVLIANTGMDHTGKRPVLVPFVTDSNAIPKICHRGKECKLLWKGGLKDEIIKVDLIPLDTVKVKRVSFASILNDQTFSFTPSGKIPVSEYFFRINNLNTGEFAETGVFKIRRRFPLGLTIALPLIGVAAISTLLYSFSKNGEVSNIQEIADPPNPHDSF